MHFFISHLINTSLFLELLNEYPSIGIESINFSVSSVLDEGPDALTRYQSELGDALNQKNLILHGPFFDLSPASFDSQIKAVTMKRFETVYTIAQQLGATKIVFHSGFIPQIYYTEGWLQNSIIFWQEFMDSKDNQITVCIENVFEDDFTAILELAQKINHPAFKLCLDIGHVHTYSSLPIREWIRNLSPYLSHIHLHNNNGSKDEHLGLMHGTIPIQECLTLINEYNPNSTITLEIYDSQELMDSLAFLYSLNLI